MTTWEKFLTALIWLRDSVTAGFATVDSVRTAQAPAEAGAATGPIAAREGAPASAGDGVDVEGLPKINVLVTYSDPAQADLTVYTWFLGADDEWYQYEADSEPTALIAEARAAALNIAGPILEPYGWKRVYFEVVSSDAGASETVSVKVFPHNEA